MSRVEIIPKMAFKPGQQVFDPVTNVQGVVEHTVTPINEHEAPVCVFKSGSSLLAAPETELRMV